MTLTEFIGNHPILSAVLVIVIFLAWQSFSGKDIGEEKKGEELKGGNTSNGTTTDK